MFEELYNSISLLGSRWWPSAQGEVTAVNIERIQYPGARDTLRLAIAYKFSIEDDGPYTGEVFWQPFFLARQRVITAHDQFHIGDPVLVRYRADDASVNTLDRCVWKDVW